MADMDLDTEKAGSTTMDLSGDIGQKFRDAAAISNKVITEVIAKLQPGADVAELCDFGDAMIVDLCSKLYNKKKDMLKGIAFPTSISRNQIVGHFSPLKSESQTLAEGDVVKVDLGAHFDGYSALVAHTVVIGASAAAPVTGPAADLIAAAHNAAEIALRLIKPGGKNTEVTDAIGKVAAAYGCSPLAGVQSANITQYSLEGSKGVPLRKDPEAKYEECTFELGEAYAVDIALSLGDGKAKESGQRTTIYRRQPDVGYQLKLKAARGLVTEVQKRFPILPFTLRACGEERDVKMGVSEAEKHGLLVGYPVYAEKEGTLTAHFRFTALLLPAGTLKLTGFDLPDYVSTAKTLPADLAAIRAAVPFVKKEKKAGAAGGDVDMSA